MNNRRATEITQKTETEEIRGENQFTSNIKLHPNMTYGAFVMNYIEELQTEINRLSKENVYLQSDEYLNSIFPTNYIQELKDKIDALEKENELLKQENIASLNSRTTFAKISDPRASMMGDLESKTSTSYGGYNRSYVKGLQDELTKLTEENFYLKSEEYRNKISAKHNQDKISAKHNQDKISTKHNQDKITAKHDQERKLMMRKIQRLSSLVQQISYDSTERETILANLKRILDHKSENIIKSTQGSFDA